ncbi:MAG: sigma-70 family RNA polymerase sigma factor [Verrucomicrobiaceae bacterium]|jgi:RNA polymerase sigma factor (sigma-70 family)|nr:sigma-70 family RNA polymerase sigma factor [Verrucomicrobiaceae bacterium]
MQEASLQGSAEPQSAPQEPVSSSAAEDRELVARAQNGDTRAFDSLIRKYTPKLYGMVYNMTSNREDTADLLQEVFAKAYRSLGRFMGKSSFYTWIYSIAVNMTLNHLKKRGRHMKVSLDDVDTGIENDPDFIAVTTAKTGVAREVNIHELQKRLNAAMMKLSEDHRTVVTLYDIQGLQHAEISKILGVSEGTVRSRLFYAHRQLQAYLEDFVK